jgi:hypothetical protein
MLDFLKPLYRRVRQVASFGKELPHLSFPENSSEGTGKAQRV